MRTGTPGGWETMLESCAARDGVLRDDVSWEKRPAYIARRLHDGILRQTRFAALYRFGDAE